MRDLLLEYMDQVIDELSPYNEDIEIYNKNGNKGQTYYYAWPNKIIGYKIGKTCHFDHLFTSRHDAIVSYLIMKYGEQDTNGKTQVAVQTNQLNDKIYVYTYKLIGNSMLMKSMKKGKITNIEEITVQEFLDSDAEEMDV